MNRTPIPPHVEGALPPVRVTLALIGLNIAVFVLTALVGGGWALDPANPILATAANHGAYTAGGDAWRLLTYAFIHWSLIHLVFNCASLAIVGSQVERALGAPRYLFIYLVSAVGAGAASLWWRPEAASGGASGAIFGIAGALLVTLYLGTDHLGRRETRRVMGFWAAYVVYGLASGFLISGVDNAAHLGGFVTGVVLSWALIRSRTRRPAAEPAVYLMAGLAVGVAGIAAIGSVNPVWMASVQATEHLRTQNVGAALAVLDRALDEHPGAEALEQLRGLVLIEGGRYQEAVDVLAPAVARDPKNPELQTLLGVAHLESGDPEAGAVHFRAALEVAPEHKQARYNLGVAYTLLGRQSEAARMLGGLATLLERGTSDPGDYLDLANAYLKLGRLDHALELADRALALNGSDPRAYVLRGHILRGLGRYPESRDDFVRLAELIPHSPAVWIEVSQAQYLAGSFDGALAAARHALRLAPENPVAQDALADALLWQGDLAGAETAARALLRLAPDDLDGATKLGFIALIQGRYDEALTYLTRHPIGSAQIDLFRGLWIGLAAAASEGAEAADAALADLALPHSGGAWPGPLIRYLRGDIGAERLLASTTTAGERCEAHFYIGFRALIEGRRAEAEAHFRASVATEMTPYFEHVGARLLLERLGATS